MVTSEQLSTIPNANETIDYSLGESTFAQLLNSAFRAPLNPRELGVMEEEKKERFYQFLRNVRTTFGAEKTGLKMSKEEATYKDVIDGLLYSLTGKRE